MFAYVPSPTNSAIIPLGTDVTPVEVILAVLRVAPKAMAKTKTRRVRAMVKTRKARAANASCENCRVMKGEA